MAGVIKYDDLIRIDQNAKSSGWNSGFSDDWSRLESICTEALFTLCSLDEAFVRDMSDSDKDALTKAEKVLVTYYYSTPVAELLAKSGINVETVELVNKQKHLRNFMREDREELPATAKDLKSEDYIRIARGSFTLFFVEERQKAFISRSVRKDQEEWADKQAVVMQEMRRSKF